MDIRINKDNVNIPRSKIEQLKYVLRVILSNPATWYISFNQKNEEWSFILLGYMCVLSKELLKQKLT